MIDYSTVQNLCSLCCLLVAVPFLCWNRLKFFNASVDNYYERSKCDDRMDRSKQLSRARPGHPPTHRSQAALWPLVNRVHQPINHQQAGRPSVVRPCCSKSCVKVSKSWYKFVKPKQKYFLRQPEFVSIRVHSWSPRKRLAGHSTINTQPSTKICTAEVK